MMYLGCLGEAAVATRHERPRSPGKEREKKAPFVYETSQVIPVQAPVCVP